MFDYESMLRRYVQMIGETEGSYFSLYWDGYFSPEEKEELKSMTNEVS